MPSSLTVILTSAPSQLGRELDAAAAIGVLGGIGEQVDEHLRQPDRIGVEHDRRLGQAQHQLVAALERCSAGSSRPPARPRSPGRRAPRRSSIRPWLMRLTSIRSSIRRDITRTWRAMTSRALRAGAARSFWYCSSCAALRTGASGLRSSWASVAMNSSLRRSASRSSASSCSSARVRSSTRRSRVSFSSLQLLLGAAALGHLGEQGAVGETSTSRLLRCSSANTATFERSTGGLTGLCR